MEGDGQRDLQAMTNEQKIIAIAEACGWIWARRKGQFDDRWIFNSATKPKFKHGICWSLGEITGDFEHCERPENGVGRGWGEKIPDYLNDLNAMHEAEKVLTMTQLSDYTYHLAEIIGSEWNWHLIKATASQRADAFLITIGKL